MHSKYIKWDELWENEIYLDLDIDEVDKESSELITQFLSDQEVSMDIDECHMTEGGMLCYMFSECGGKSEGDTEGWFRYYILIFDKEYLLKSICYEQG